MWDIEIWPFALVTKPLPRDISNSLSYLNMCIEIIFTSHNFSNPESTSLDPLQLLSTPEVGTKNQTLTGRVWEQNLKLRPHGRALFLPSLWENHYSLNISFEPQGWLSCFQTPIRFCIKCFCYAPIIHKLQTPYWLAKGYKFPPLLLYYAPELNPSSQPLPHLCFWSLRSALLLPTALGPCTSSWWATTAGPVSS